MPMRAAAALPSAEPGRIRAQIEEVIGLDAEQTLKISAKTGDGIIDVLEALVTRLPAPEAGDPAAPLKTLLVDSWYDPYLGVVALVRVREGTLRRGMKIRMMATDATHDVDRVGVFTPKRVETGELGPGEVGFITASIKSVADCQVGDTLTEDRRPTETALPGFRPTVPVVFCGLFPVDTNDYEDLRESLAKLALNDASLHYEPESSAALGFGAMCCVALQRRFQSALFAAVQQLAGYVCAQLELVALIDTHALAAKHGLAGRPALAPADEQRPDAPADGQLARQRRRLVEVSVWWRWKGGT